MDKPTLEGCDAKLARARKHLVALHKEIGAEDAPKDPLAILNWLSNVDKHQVLHATFVAVTEPNPDNYVVEGDDTGTAEFEFTSGPLKDGAEVLRIRVRSENPEAKVHVKAPIPMGIGFGERGISAHIFPNLLGQVGVILDAYRPEFA